MNHQYFQNVKESFEFVRKCITENPVTAIVLGSGLGDFGELLSDKIVISTANIPHYPHSTVPGHAGIIIFGRMKAADRTSEYLMVFQGRIHFYECGNLDTVVYPIELANLFNIRNLIITNAAGGINKQFTPGDLMFIRDYLNLAFENPLTGRSEKKMAHLRPVMDEAMLQSGKKAALDNSIPTKEGIYCWTKGPTYESASEIQMMAKAGADAVGMSTVPEIIVAASYGIRILGISCITNFATGLSNEKLTHADVTVVANRVKNNFSKLLTEIIFTMPCQTSP